jgi:hypothetical protein
MEGVGKKVTAEGWLWADGLWTQPAEVVQVVTEEGRAQASKAPVATLMRRPAELDRKTAKPGGLRM